MQRKTLQDALDSRIPEAVNLPPSDPRVIAYINEAQDRVIKRGHWWGTMGRFNIAVTNGLISTPRQIASIERASINRSIVPVHDFWYEWLDNGWGPMDETMPDGRLGCEFRGNYPLATDVFGTDVALRFICDLSVDSGKQVLVQGYDFSSPPNWVRTQIGATANFQSGELITIRTSAEPLVFSSTSWTQVTGIQFPNDLQGQVWCYQYDNNTHQFTLLGQYEPSNTRPAFARYFFPSLLPVTQGSTYKVEVLAKLDFIPVSIGSDFLTIGNLAALKKACMSIKAEEELRFSDASLLMDGGVNPKTKVYIRGAIQELDSELDHYLGSGRKIGINVQGWNFGSVDPVEQLL